VAKIQSKSFADHHCAELSGKNTNTRRKVGGNPPLQLREYSAGKSMTSEACRFYSPDISPSDFCFEGYAKKQINNGVIKEEDDLEAS
jgi:hypothetical protein